MSFIPHLHTDLLRTLGTRRGATRDPDAVPIGAHKSYPRMPQIPLPPPAPLSMTLSEALEKRASFGAASTDSLSLAVCGTLLGAALKEHENSTRRHYPSGGSLYPIETYLVTGALEGAPPSAFHYDPTGHRLERLVGLPEDMIVKDLVRDPNDQEFLALIVFTGVWQRSSAKYGDFAYLLAVLEAGHMSENILLVATALGLSARPMGGADSQAVSGLLDLDPDEEQPVHSIIIF